MSRGIIVGEFSSLQETLEKIAEERIYTQDSIDRRKAHRQGVRRLQDYYKIFIRETFGKNFYATCKGQLHK